MNKKAFIKNVIRTTLAEAYVKQASAREVTPYVDNASTTTVIAPPVTRLQKQLLPAQGALGGAYAGATTGFFTALMGSKKMVPERKKLIAASLIGAAVGAPLGAGSGFLHNYLQTKLRQQQLEEFAKERMTSYKFKDS